MAVPTNLKLKPNSSANPSINPPQQLDVQALQDPESVGFLTSIAEKFGLSEATSLPEGTTVTPGERKQLAPNPIDLIGGFLATKGLPLLAASNPIGAVMALVGLSMTGKQSKKRQRLAERLVDNQAARNSAEENRRAREVDFGQRIVTTQMTNTAQMGMLDKRIKADIANRMARQKFDAEQGNFDRKNATENARLNRLSGDVLGLSKILTSIDQKSADNQLKILSNTPGAQERQGNIDKNRSLIIARMLSLMASGDEGMQLLAEEYRGVFGLGESGEGTSDLPEEGDLVIDPKTGKLVPFTGKGK